MAQGQIERRGERLFRLRWFLGRDASGKRHYGSRTVRGTKREAASVLREILATQERGIVVESKGITLDAYLDRWLVEAAPKKRRDRTVRDYSDVLRWYVRPLLGRIRLDRLSVLDVQGMVNHLETKGAPPRQEPELEGRRRRKQRAPVPLSPQTIRYAHAVLSAALSQAVRWRLLAANPTRDVEMPRRSTKRPMRALTPEECGKFREAATGHRLEAFFLLLLGTGLRPGEALALRWADVDLDAGSLRVERSLGRRTKGTPLPFDDPKTATSRRAVPLPPSVTRAIRAHRAAQAEERLRAGSAYADLDLVFATHFGQPLDERNVVNRSFKPLLERAELPKAVRLYDLRHTAATLMLASGASPRTVAERLGHASAKMTLDVYAHGLQPQRDELTASIERALFETR